MVAGNRHRIYHIGKLLERCGAVTLLVVSRYDFDDWALEASRKEFPDFVYMRASEVPSSSLLGKARRLLDKRWVRGRSIALGENERNAIENLIRDHDVVWIHTLEVADRVGIYKWSRCVIDLDDLNYTKQKMMASVRKSLKGKVGDWWRCALWRRWERDAANRFQTVTVCSKEDRALLGNGEEIHVVPNGFDVPGKRAEFRVRDKHLLGFLGTLEYDANLEGLTWFVKEVLPRILLEVPGVRVKVVGLPPVRGGTPDSSLNVDVLGFLDDYSREVETWSAMVVPLRIGGGTRIKILDAFSRMCPVVSTSVGAYGLEVKHGRELIIADTAEAFSKACVELMADPESARPLTENAWNSVSSIYSWDGSIGERVREALSGCTGSFGSEGCQ